MKALNNEVKVGFALSAVLGASAGPILGYFIHAVAQGASGAVRFTRWLSEPIIYGWLWWALFGACFGAGFFAASKLAHARL